MSLSKMKIMIVDDVPEIRSGIKTLLELDGGFQVIGEASQGVEAIKKAAELRPDCILMDVNMPVMDGITATEEIGIKVPTSVIVMMSVQGEQEYLRKAMLAGARDYLIKPFAADDLAQTIRRACAVEAERRKNHSDWSGGSLEPGRVISVFSTKGGVGKTTTAANLAVLLASHGERVALVDLDLQFGDAPVWLDIIPTHTLAELAREEEIDVDLLQQYLVEHASGVHLLAAPHRPEEAEMVRPKLLRPIFEHLRSLFSWVVVDMSHGFHEIVLEGLDMSDHVMFVVTADVPTVKNARLGLDVMHSLSYEAEKISLVLNRHGDTSGLDIGVVEENLRIPVAVKVPYEPDIVVPAMNEGRPFVVSHPETGVSRAIKEIGALIGWVAPVQSKRQRGLFRFLARA